MSNLIKPHGSDTLNPLYVMDDAERAALVKEAEGLPSVVVCSAAAANAVMMGGGYFNPLTGYMNVADAMSIAKNLRTASGLFFPVPILNMLEDISTIQGADRIALRDPNVEGNPVIAIQQVESIEEISDEQMKTLTMKIYVTS